VVAVAVECDALAVYRVHDSIEMPEGVHDPVQCRDGVAVCAMLRVSPAASAQPRYRATQTGDRAIDYSLR
jgi:hypothetical protein